MVTLIISLSYHTISYNHIVSCHVIVIIVIFRSSNRYSSLYRAGVRVPEKEIMKTKRKERKKRKKEKKKSEAKVGCHLDDIIFGHDDIYAGKERRYMAKGARVGRRTVRRFSCMCAR